MTETTDGMRMKHAVRSQEDISPKVYVRYEQTKSLSNAVAASTPEDLQNTHTLLDDVPTDMIEIRSGNGVQSWPKCSRDFNTDTAGRHFLSWTMIGCVVE